MIIEAVVLVVALVAFREPQRHARAGKIKWKEGEIRAWHKDGVIAHVHLGVNRTTFQTR